MGDRGATNPLYPCLVTLLLLIRHAVTDHTGKRLYGRSEGIHLSETGRYQASRLAERMREVRLEALYTSPMDRCRETASILAGGRRLRPRTLGDLNEVDYGEWTGRALGALRRTKVWRQVRSSPASVRFPGGESLFEVQERAVRAVQEISARHPHGTVAVVSHGDVIRLCLAHYAGVHLDLFQRLEVDTASVTALLLEGGGPRVVRVNDTGTLAGLPTGRGKVGG